nr:mechanosensitive ion channel domain-containing protein [uncultured Desulfobulbus sp.]
MITSLESFFPLLLVLIGMGFLLKGVHWLLIGRFPEMGDERKFPRQLIVMGLSLFGVVIAVLVLPVGESSRNQLIGLVGLIVSGVIAFSSTTIIANLMAGLLLRITKPFRVGDFIRIGEYFGRVSERGLLDTEIQTATRELISLPNSYCIGHPVATILGSGTIISASLSLGYDLDHKRIEQLLVEAAQSCDLQEPFVHILQLGDFSVTYRVSGFLQETRHLITAQSLLHGCVLDTLHSHGVVIVSPTFMNQRRLEREERILPPHATVGKTSLSETTAAEDIAFDKAEKAKRVEDEKQQLAKEIAELESVIKTETDQDHKSSNLSVLEQKRERLKALETHDKSSEVETP